MPQRIHLLYAAVLLGLVLAIGYLAWDRASKTAQIDNLSKELQAIKEAEQKKTQAAAEAAATRARSTPAMFGYYYTDNQTPLRMLQVLQRFANDGMADTPRYLAPPDFLIKKGTAAHLVLFDRMFSMAAPPQMFIQIVAKIKNDDGWVVRDRGYNARVAPRTDNRDILDMFLNYSPGRYAIKSPGDGRLYSFAVEGENDTPDFCVQKVPNIALRQYTVCPGGTPD